MAGSTARSSNRRACSGVNSSAFPVRDRETGDTTKLALVVRNQREFPSHGLGSDEGVEWSDRYTRAVKFRAHACIRSRIIRAEIDESQRSKKVLDEMKSLYRRRALRSARSQLGFGDDAHQHVFAWCREELLEHVLILLESVDAGIRVENEHLPA
jgi:hypothetical protein